MVPAQALVQATLAPGSVLNPRSFAGADIMLLVDVANTTSSSPGCYGQHAVQVPQQASLSASRLGWSRVLPKPLSLQPSRSEDLGPVGLLLLQASPLVSGRSSSR